MQIDARSHELLVLRAPAPIPAHVAAHIKAEVESAIATPPHILVLERRWHFERVPLPQRDPPAPAGWDELENVR